MFPALALGGYKMTQNIAVLGLETMEGRVVLSGMTNELPTEFDDCTAATCRSSAVDGAESGDSVARNGQSDDPDTVESGVLKTDLCC